MPPQGIHFIDNDGNFYFIPFVFGLKQEVDPITWRKTYVEDKNVIHPISFLKKDTSIVYLVF